MKFRSFFAPAGMLALALTSSHAFAGGVAVGVRIGGPVYPAYYQPYPVAVAAPPVVEPAYAVAPVAVVAPPVVVAAPVVAVRPVVVGARYWGSRAVVVVR